MHDGNEYIFTISPQVFYNDCIIVPYFLQQIVSYRLHGGTETKGALLDPNHTHLILVDDGKEGHYGADIPVRAKLLKLMAQTSDFAGEFSDTFSEYAKDVSLSRIFVSILTVKVLTKWGVSLQIVSSTVWVLIAIN